MRRSSDVYRLIGQNVRAKRRALGMTLEQLEEASNVSASFIGQIERNAKKASLSTLGKLASGLGVPIHSMFQPDHADGEVGLLHSQIAALLRAHRDHESAFLLATLRWLSRRLVALRVIRRRSAGLAAE